MSKPAIEVEKLGKRYIINHKRKPDSLRELLMSNPLGWTRNAVLEKEVFWALKDVTFDVRQGETFGIVGRNGAGKSTLLKILSHIVTPTEGKATIRGKTASLLEVGTGFHNELSGRENVFFNGALLGMSKAEIARKYEEIVEFSEVGHFIDNPVKHYSSGMRARLAFSVAAHLEAEIMIIDEALSAGDVAFRKKAQEKMKAAAFDGRSVLFVTHNMGSAIDLCDRALYLQNGRQLMVDDTKKVVEAYLGTAEKDAGPTWKATDDMQLTDDRIVPQKLNLLVNGKPLGHTSVNHDDKVEVELTVAIDKPSDSMSIGFSLLDEQSRRLFRSAHTDLPKGNRPALKRGENTFKVAIPLEYLKEGRYRVALDCDIYKDNWVIKPNSTDAFVGFALSENKAIAPWDIKREAILKPKLSWKHSD
jgi:lipopolysaccharide transport system ATP-binding protein